MDVLWWNTLRYSTLQPHPLSVGTLYDMVEYAIAIPPYSNPCPQP